MDPAGIREILLVRSYASNPYQFEFIARGLPYKTRVRPHYSSIPWLPVFPPLTQRVSTISEGYVGYLQYDCLILAGTDLESCAERDLQHIHAALARGLAALVCGGLFGLGNSYRLWHDFKDVLPARVLPARSVACGDEVIAVADHPLLRGLAVTPRWTSSCPDLDVGVRLGEGVCLVPVANLSSRACAGCVTLHDLPFVPAFAVNLTDGVLLALISGEPRFEVALEGYHGALLALFPARPVACQVTVGHAAIRPGDMLVYEVVVLDEAGCPAAGTYLIEATVTAVDGTVHGRLGGPLVARDGCVAVGRRIPVNAVSGTWTLALCDPILGLSARTEFNVKETISGF